MEEANKNILDLKDKLGISSKDIFQYFFPYLLLKQIKINSEIKKYLNLKDTRDQLVGAILDEDSGQDKYITNFELTMLRKKFEEELKLIEVIDSSKIDEKMKIFKSTGGSPGKFFQLTKVGETFLDSKIDNDIQTIINKITF